MKLLKQKIDTFGKKAEEKDSVLTLNIHLIIEPVSNLEEEDVIIQEEVTQDIVVEDHMETKEATIQEDASFQGEKSSLCKDK